MTQQMPSSPIDYATPNILPKKRGPFRLFGWILFVGLAVMLFLLLQNNRRVAVSLSLDEFNDALVGEKIVDVRIGQDEITGTLVTPAIAIGRPRTEFRAALPSGTTSTWDFTHWLIENRHGARIFVDNNQNLLINILVPIIPWLLIFGFVWFFIFRQIRGMRGQNAPPTRVVVVNPEAT